MTTQKKKLPIIPKERTTADVPLDELGLYNWRVSDGDFVTEELDEHGLPRAEPVLPKKKKKKDGK